MAKHGVAPALQPDLAGIVIPATTMPFVARDHFVVSTMKISHLLSSFGRWLLGKKSSAVKISNLTNDFRKWFLGKEEQPFKGSTLYGKSNVVSGDTSTIKELGDKEKAEITLTELYALMQAQNQGQEGPLLTNESTNIFYIKDANTVLRAVCVYWYYGGWDVCALSVTDPFVWHDGGKVFSRNP